MMWAMSVWLIWLLCGLEDESLRIKYKDAQSAVKSAQVKRNQCLSFGQIPEKRFQWENARRVVTLAVRSLTMVKQFLVWGHAA